MSYPNPVAPGAPPARPGAVTLAVGVLVALALGGLAYALAGLFLLPGVIDRYRDRAAPTGARSGDLIALPVGLTAAAVVVAIAIGTLLLLLARGLARRSGPARVVTWLVCAAGLLCGGGSFAVVVLQRVVPVLSAADGATADLVVALTGAYPGWWLPLGAVLPVLQVLGYLAVALLLLSPAANRYFRRTVAPTMPANQPR